MACSSISGSPLLQLPSFGSKNLTMFSTNYASEVLPSSTSASSKRSTSIRCSKNAVRDLRPQLDEYPEGIISGEWTENFSFLSYDDLRAYFESQPIINKMNPSALLGEIMSMPIRTATPEQRLEEIDHHFEVVSGLPVVDGELRCMGVVSKKDRDRASLGLKTMVGEVMSSPAITLTPDKTVLDAAAIMLKMKIHRIPIVNQESQVIGIITRSDVFRALGILDI